MEKIYWIAMNFWLWFGTKILKWEYVDIYSPDKKNVTAVTFSQDEKYINKVMKIK